MADIFISYARADRARAERLAEALERLGWSVWWDRHILPGKTFDEVIEQALDSCLCVVVLWSQSSVTSSWVKTEAAEGVRRGVLVPVRIEDVQVPLEFRRAQTANLAGWPGAFSQQEFESFLGAVSAVIGSAPHHQLSPLDTPRGNAATASHMASTAVVSADNLPVVCSMAEIEELSKNGYVLLLTFKAEALLGEALVSRRLKKIVIDCVLPLARGRGVNVCLGNLQKGLISRQSELAKDLRRHNGNFEGWFLFRGAELIAKTKLSGSLIQEEYVAAAEQIIRDVA
jgi:hypothetical protein